MLKGLFSSPGFDLAIDLGTSNVLVSAADGVRVDAPAYVALRERASGRREVLAVGDAARELSGKTTDDVRVLRPLAEGVIRDLDLTVVLLRTLLGQADSGRRRLRRPRVLLTLPREVTEVEARAFRQAAQLAGAGELSLLPEPLVAAVGSGNDVLAPRGVCVVDIGAGTTEVAVLSLGGIVSSGALRVGGDALDAEIVRHFRRKHDFLLGTLSAERLKRSLSQVAPTEDLEVHGIELLRRRPASLRVGAAELIEALQPLIHRLVEAIAKSLESVPDEISSDLADQGLWLCGGGALTRGLAERVGERCGLKVRVAEDALRSVALGEIAILRDAGLRRGLRDFV